ncbi:MAG TPA: alpha/beta hydrolase-fold protein [Gemmatimonadaceae bacterium]|nr:alpha/beta hydrolase-fold protein [Gemmatimonadaceae bacterium]
MHREHHRWFSPALGRDMELLRFGHAGARVLVFPTSMGRFYEWEDRGMIGALADAIDQGWFQLTCVDSVDEDSWYAKWKRPGDRAWRHVQYDTYLRDEVLPLTRSNPDPFLITVGASFGAYHAMNFALRYPHEVGRVVGLSGLYDVRGQTDGYSDDNVYFHNPADFVAGEQDPGRLAALRRVSIIMAIGRDDPMCRANEQFSGILWGKDIWHALRIWDGWAHDWPYWRHMIGRYIGGHD